MSAPWIEIGGRRVGGDRPAWIVAEMGVNHCGDPALALRLVDGARAAGADAVKVQVFRADRLVAAGTPAAAYQEGTGDARSLLRPLEMDAAALRGVRERARRAGLAFVASPFDDGSLDRVATLEPEAVTLASGELVSPLLARAAGLGAPLLVSTGMATLEEIDRARATLEAAGARYALLHCVSAYPTPPVEANLRAIETLRRRYRVPVGYSDHTEGDRAAALAVALGAAVIEKHLTLDRSLPGPDHHVSLEPEGLRALVRRVREAEAMLGTGEKAPQPAEREALRLARKALYAARAISPGEPIEASDLIALRPADGIPAARVEDVTGRRAARAIPAGAPLRWEDLD